MRRIRRLTGARYSAGHAVWLWAMVFAVTVISAGSARAFDPAQSLSLQKDTATGLVNAAAMQKNAGPLVPNAGSTIYDTTVPVPGTATAPAHANTSPVTISYAGAADTGGSGIKTVGLWVKYGVTGTWVDTGLTATGASGSFSYIADLGDGQYRFALKAADNAGNLSIDPSVAGDTLMVYDTSKPVITLVGGDVALQSGATYTDAGATATDAQDGDLTSKIVKVSNVNTAVAGAYTVTYNVSDAAGNAAVQVVRNVTVGAAPTYAVNIFQPAHGSILVNPAPGSDGKYAGGATLTFTYQPDATAPYDLTGWSGVTQDGSNPSLAHLTVTSVPVNVSVAITRQAGSVSVTVSPTSATWSVTDGDGAKHAGAGTKVLTGIPTGAVSIAYDAITGMATPNPYRSTRPAGRASFL